ncbi:MAG: hypothetical protein H0T73_21635 [Ardenticatenales bacterium]|nr:hypothetical protein [Ardenticatenales bacterium]
MHRKRISLLFALCLTWLVISACASATPAPGNPEVPGQERQGTPGTEGAPGQEMQTPESTVAPAELAEFTLTMPGTLTAGPLTFEVTNAGTMAHNFEVEGNGIEEAFESNLMPGETRTMQLDLAAGTYEVYCPIGDHADRGMRVELTITE